MATIASKPAVGFEIMVMSVSKIQRSDGCLQDYGRDVSFSSFSSPHLYSRDKPDVGVAIIIIH